MCGFVNEAEEALDRQVESPAGYFLNSVVMIAGINRLRENGRAVEDVVR